MGDCGHDKAEDVDSVHYTLLTRLSELLPLLVSPVLYMHLTVCLFVIFIAFPVVEYLIVQSQYSCNCSNFVNMRNKALML